MTALLIAGEVRTLIFIPWSKPRRLTRRNTQGGVDTEEIEDDEEYDDAPLEKSATSSVAGTKRTREEEEDVDRQDDDLEAAEEGIAKKARTATEPEEAEEV